MIQITVISAEAKREESALIKKQLEERLAREKEIVDKRVAELVPNILEHCTAILNHTKTAENRVVAEFFIFDKFFKDVPIEEIDKAFATVKELLNIAGYKVTYYIYSKSWQTRSKKLGYIDMRW